MNDGSPGVRGEQAENLLKDALDKLNLLAASFQLDLGVAE